ncbi:hypothetical protein ACROYT_G020712 [Oculina patagonica]
MKGVKVYISKIRVLSSQELSLKPLLVLAFLLFMTNISANEATCKQEKITWGSALANPTYKKIHAYNFDGCLLKCNQDPQCRSCNFWWNKLECELNFAAKYSAPTSFISEVNCIHRDMDLQPENWFVEIPGEVCMAAKDDKPGKFLTPMTGKISAIKLVYISGKVGCTSIHISNWGCDDNSNLLTIITDDQNNVILPENYNIDQNSYTLPGFAANSPELLFTFSTPMEVTAGQEYRVWYKEDLSNQEESDNYSGATCMRVVAIFSI